MIVLCIQIRINLFNFYSNVLETSSNTTNSYFDVPIVIDT